MVTIFKDSFDTQNPHYISVDAALQRIKSGKSKETVEGIRKLKAEGKDTSPLKKQLPSVIFSGEAKNKIEKTYKSGAKKGQSYVSYRDDESMVSHSGFAVLDFDHVDVSDTKYRLAKDEYVYAAWRSPSGDGVKALVKFPKDLAAHPEHYNALIERYPELDSTSRSLSRLCFESYDPDIYIKENSAVWSRKKKVQEKKEVALPSTEVKTDYRKIQVAVDMVRSAPEGSKHEVLLKASRLLGGYIAVGKVDEMLAQSTLEQEINSRDIKDFEGAKKTILDGIEYGKRMPIFEVKKIEREHKFAKDESGEFMFLAKDEDMDVVLQKFRDGTLEMGVYTGINNLDNHLSIKKNTFFMWGGVDNVGKSVVVWYIFTINAMMNGQKALIFSAENSDAQVKRKIIEFYFGEPYSNLRPEQVEEGKKFFKAHFKLISSGQSVYTYREILDMAEVVYDKGWEYDVFYIDPYNSLMTPKQMNKYDANYEALSHMRVFKEQYCTLWLSVHATSEAARKRDGDGYVVRPYKSDFEGGQPFANRGDDIGVIHRLTNHPEEWMVTRIYIDKVKDTDTGGKVTSKDEYVAMRMNLNGCGFTCGIQDVVFNYWKKRNETQPINPSQIEFEGEF